MDGVDGVSGVVGMNAPSVGETHHAPHLQTKREPRCDACSPVRTGHSPGVLSPAQSSVFQEVHSYVSSPEGQTRIHQALLRHRLPTALDADIEEAVISEALRFIRKGNEIASPAGWCNARISARAIDLARGVIRRRLADEDRSHSEYDQCADDQQDALGDVFPRDESPASSSTLSGWRSTVLHADADPYDVCAVLTTISVLAEGVPLVEECPQPQAGATREEAACWAGLWYANRAECFGEGNTITKRRSRATKRLKQLLREATAALTTKDRT